MVGRTQRASAVGVVGWTAFALLLLANPMGLRPVSNPSTALEAGGHTAPGAIAPSSPTLSIQQPQFPAEGTTTQSLGAQWSRAPFGCVLHPEWSTWFLPSPAAAGGTFETPTEPSTGFVPTNLTWSVSEVAVRSAAQLSCGGSNRTVQQTAYSNVTTYPTLSVTDVSADPRATAAPGTVQLGATVVGGRPPYLVGIDWGDGSFINQTLPAAGAFVVSHNFSSGTYRPRIGVYDSDRIDVRGAVPEAIEVSNGTALQINASAPLAEVGVPVDFEGSVERPSVRFGAIIACTTDPVVQPRYYITNVTCTPAAAGLLGVTFKVGSPAPTQIVQSTREEPVAPAVALSVEPWTNALDSRTPTYLRVTISGGVPPFRVTWGSRNGSLGERAVAPADGAFLVPWTPPYAGPNGLNGSVADSLGASAASPWVKLIVGSAPNLTLWANTTNGPSATWVEVQARVVGGTGPLFWDLETDSDFTSGNSSAGRSLNSSFGWSGSFPEEGNASLVVLVEDAATSLVTGTLTVGLPIAPTLRVWAAPNNFTGAPGVNLTFVAVGGVLPYTLWVNSTEGTLWNASEASAGPYEASLLLLGSGPVPLNVTLRDARGAEASVNLTAALPSPPPLPPTRSVRSGSDLAPELVGLVLICLVLGVGTIAWRRRARPVDLPPPDPDSVLERLLRPADGADRLTIELMAEEEGIPLESVRAALDRLIHEGRVRSESDPDGGEVLAWATD
ncbi:MAG: hypothetical protein L3K02_01155 [Thermoplasmata archaeon]|nr:hypothetical protein [Thermoplasmata archaeon]